jgi:hypothetical protein
MSWKGPFSTALVSGALLLYMAAPRPAAAQIPGTNRPPVADAGPDQAVETGHTATLDASRSSDPDGNPLTYVWTFLSRPAGSTAVIGDPRAVRPTLVADRDGAYVVQLMVLDGRTKALDSVTLTAGPGNSAPVADAGPDQTVPAGVTVTLDGSGSSDVDGDPLTFQWRLVSIPAGSVAALSDPSAVRPTFLVDRPGRYLAELVVSDGQAASAPDTVAVDTRNSAPVASAGPDQSATLGTPAVLDGSGSSDVDGDPLTFQWSLVATPAGSAAVLDAPGSVSPSFLVDLPGTYVAQLVVNDGTVSSAPDTVVVTTENRPPVAAAGADQTVPLGGVVGLDGGGSGDPDGDPITFRWSLASVPAGSAALLSDPNAQAPTFVADRRGTYVAQLIVNDGQLDSVPDTVAISTENSAPRADAGLDQAVTAGATVALDGSGSSDPDGDPITFAWSFLSRPAGSAAALSDPTASAPTFVADRPGAFLVQLMVSDGVLASEPDSVLIEAGRPIVTVDAPDAFAAEAGLEAGRFVFFRTGSATSPLTVAFTLGGTAGAADHAPLPSVVTFPAGEAFTDLVLTPVDDTDPEGDETVVLTLAPGGDYDVGADDEATVTIVDDDLPVVTVAATDAQAAEAGLDPGTFTVSRTGNAAAVLTVSYTIAGSAAAGDDYVALAGTVSFPAGAASVPVTVTPIDDALFETPETVELTLASGAGYAVGAADEARVTILDDERPVVTLVATDDEAAEAGPDPGVFTVTRTGPTTDALTVLYGVFGSATNGVDYVALSGRVVIPAGSATAAVTVTPIDDTETEAGESVFLAVATSPDYVVGFPAIDSVSITDHVSLSVVATDPEASEATLDGGLFTFERSGSTAAPLLLLVVRSGTASSGSDYVSLGGSAILVTIPAGQSSTTLAVTPLRDNQAEGPETLTLTLQPSTSYTIVAPGAATVTIADDPAVVSVAATDPAAAEAGLDPGTFTFTRTGGNLAAAVTVQFNLAGTAGPGDYVSLGGSIVIPAGQATAAASLVPRADNAVEADETVVLTLQTTTSYVVGSGPATLTIADDPPVVSVQASDPDAAESPLDAGTFTFTRSGGNLDAALNLFAARSGTALNGSDYVGLGGGTLLVTFAVGSATAAVTVTPIDDAVAEGPETVVLTISPLPNYVIGQPGSATVTIASDE